MTRKDLVFNIYSFIRMADMFIATKLKYFQEIMWLYLFDVPEIELVEGFSNDFMPVLAKPFFKGFKVSTKRVRRQEDTAGVGIILKRKMQTSGFEAQNFEDLDMMTKTLLQYCMLYNSEMSETDWESIDQGIEIDFINVNKKII